MNTKQYIRELASREDITSEAFQKLISALRGPDGLKHVEGLSYSCKGQLLYELKYLTTARVRAIVAPKYYGDVTHIPLTSEQRQRRDKLLADHAFRHFREHYLDAVAVIRDLYKYDLLTETSLRDV